MDQCAERKLKAESENTDDEACVYHYYFHRARIELVEQRKKYDAMEKQRDQLKDEIEKFEQNPPPPSFLTSFERFIIFSLSARMQIFYKTATGLAYCKLGICECNSDK